MKLDELNKQFAERKKKKQKEELKKELQKTLLAAVLVLALGGGILVMLLINIPSLESDISNTVSGTVMDGYPKGITQKDLIDALQEEIDESMFKISQMARAVFDNGSAKGTVNIINSEGNKKPCKVRITLAEEEQTVLYESSEFIWPEQYIPTIRLKENLEKGVYPVTVTYYIYDAEGKEEEGVLAAGMELVIQS